MEAPVEYIVLPTFAYEHKVFVGPFSRKFPRAHVWVAPRQWSWPVDLPLQFFGIFGAKILRNDDKSAPWVDEIDYKILSCSVGESFILFYSSPPLLTPDDDDDDGGGGGILRTFSTLTDIIVRFQVLAHMWRWHSSTSSQRYCC